MSGRKSGLVTLGFVVSVSLIACAVSVLCVSCHYSRLQFELVNAICSEMVEREPETKNIIFAVLKEHTGGNPDGPAKEDVLPLLGYRISDFSGPVCGQYVLFTAAGLMTGVLLFLFTLLYRNKIEGLRIRALAEYLEQANAGKAPILSASGEDEFSRLEDEIYKTVTFLYRTRDVAVQARDDFAENLSNIAHQIKTPISVMRMMLQAEDTKENRELLAQLFRIEQYAEMALGYLRLDSDSSDFIFQEYSLDDIIRQAIHKYAAQFVRKRIRLQYEPVNITVLTDEKWLLFIIEQILSNAVKYTQEGKVTITVTKEKVLQIADTGIGIAPEDLPRIFEKGFTGYNGRADRKSTGLGLYLCKMAADRLSHQIDADSEAGKGTVFSIDLSTEKLSLL